MDCPGCRRAVSEGDWFCPWCATQLHDRAQIDRFKADAPAAPDDAFAALEAPTFEDEVTSTLAWKRSPEMLTGEALIVGELSGEIDLDEAGVPTFEAVAPGLEGITQGLLLYADSSSTKLLSPSAVPRLVSLVPEDVLLTPYEEYLVTFINGRRTIRELQEAGLLAPEEMSVSILTLVDRGLITLAPEDDQARLVDRTELVRAQDLAPALADDLELPSFSRPEPSPIALDPSALVPLEPTPSPIPPKPTTPPRRNDPPPAPAPIERAPISKKQESKAADLFRASLRDRSVGNVVSARMNLKLAIAFDPHNREYKDAFRALADAPATASDAPPRPLHAAAAKLYDEAGKAEANGELDRAVRLLDRALQTSKEPVVMNRLGVILATRKHDYRRAQELLEAAVEIDPHNSAYTHNLGKVLAAAAVHVEAKKEDGARAKGRLASFWDRLRGTQSKPRS
jgi:tetratricopeptide (TPR) repeat protein